jgi:hypothetical protein
MLGFLNRWLILSGRLTILPFFTVFYLVLLTCLAKLGLGS